MNWVKIGNINLSNTWSLISVTEGNLFRITQSWDIYPQGAKALIAQSISSNPLEIYGIKAFYPSEDIKILNLPIPLDFLNASINSRFLIAKFYSRRQFTFNWNITIEKFINN